jgi:uncharacterized protein
MATLFETLKEKGVKEENIQTVHFSVDENYREVWGIDPDDPKKKTRDMVLDGFSVNNHVSVTVCELDKFGDILDAVTANGANQVQRIAFGSSKANEKMMEARKKAVEDAMAKATVIADALNVKLIRVISVTEDNYSHNRDQVYISSGPGEGRTGRSVPLSGGSLSYKVTVFIKWEIKGKPLTSEK